MICSKSSKQHDPSIWKKGDLNRLGGSENYYSAHFIRWGGGWIWLISCINYWFWIPVCNPGIKWHRNFRNTPQYLLRRKIRRGVHFWHFQNDLRTPFGRNVALKSQHGSFPPNMNDCPIEPKRSSGWQSEPFSTGRSSQIVLEVPEMNSSSNFTSE